MNAVMLKLVYLFKLTVAALPAVAAIYLLYWLEQSGTWVPQTPHRDKITVAVLVVGMLGSFFVQSYFLKAAKAKAS